MMYSEANVKFIIQKYNFLTGKRIQVKTNCEAVESALQKADTVSELIGFIQNEVKENEGTDLKEICIKFCDSKVVAPEPAEPQPQPQPMQTADAMAIISQTITSILAQTKVGEIKDEVLESVDKFISEKYGSITRKVAFDFGDRKFEPKGCVHTKFEQVMKFVQADEPVFLVGPAGTGKNFICKQVAEALELPFYFSNAVTQEYKLTGFTDANGVFHESQFYKAFKNGGVFMLDEMDASIPEVLVILNAAIANRYFDFPAPIGMVEAHENFRVVAAGNTTGNGADMQYVGRYQLDMASLDRFAVINIDYDAKIEESVAGGNLSLVKFCRKFRKACQEAGIQTVVSYRAIKRMAKLDEAMETTELLRTCLIKGMTIDDLNAIRASLTGCGKYTEAFEEIVTK